MAAILLPVFARARENARSSSCLNNEKQIGIAIIAYVQDYDEKYPARQIGPLYWSQQIYSYIKSVNVFMCPSNSRNTNIANGVQGAIPAIPISYAYNARFGDQGSGFNMSTVNEPANKIIVSEIYLQNWSDYGSCWWTGGGNWNQGFAGHGSSRCNYLMSDGHAKSMNPTATDATINMWGAVTGNNCNAGDINTDTPDTVNIDPGLKALDALFP